MIDEEEVRDVLYQLMTITRDLDGQPCWCNHEYAKSGHKGQCAAARELWAKVKCD